MEKEATTLNLGDETRQMSRQLEFPWMDRGEAPKDLQRK
ncbi:MAG: hypothetical protein ACI87O_002243 [Planctomycetota bacterium]|jgi:hypothetical protein